MKKQKGSQSNTKTGATINYNLPTIDPNHFNQTIIINNPNFNINYIQSNNRNNISNLNHQPLNQPLISLKDSARKTQNDNWNLNYNLKQFSETRQLGFFNNKNQKRNASNNSPYLLPKNKTQDINPISKIRPNQTINYGASYKSNLNPPKSNRSIPVIARQHSPQNTINSNTKLPSHLTLNRQPIQQGTQSNFRSKKYQYTQKTPRQINTHRTIGQNSYPYLAKIEQQKIQDGKQIRDTLHQKLKNGAIHSGVQTNYTKIKHNIRRNRFSSVQQQDRSRNNTNKTVLQQQKQQNKQEQQQVESPTHSMKNVNIQPKILNEKKMSKSRIHFKFHSQNHSQYNKSIQLIHQYLLSNLNQYMDGGEIQKEDMPATKIQLFMSTMRDPQPILFGQAHHNPQYRSTPMNLWQQYDFKFDQQKNKKRPKTPKRKKLYQ